MLKTVRVISNNYRNIISILTLPVILWGITILIGDTYDTHIWMILYLSSLLYIISFKSKQMVLLLYSMPVKRLDIERAFFQYGYVNLTAGVMASLLYIILMFITQGNVSLLLESIVYLIISIPFYAIGYNISYLLSNNTKGVYTGKAIKFVFSIISMVVAMIVCMITPSGVLQLLVILVAIITTAFSYNRCLKRCVK